MSTFYVHEGTRYFVGVPFSYNEINYTHEGATDQTFTELGFKQVNSDPRPDDRYYVVNSYPNDEGHWDVQSRNLKELQEAAIDSAKSAAGALLSSSDWYVVRNFETGAEVPLETTLYRSQVREAESLYEAAVNNVKTLEEFIGLGEPSWPVIPNSEDDDEIPVSK